MLFLSTGYDNSFIDPGITNIRAAAGKLRGIRMISWGPDSEGYRQNTSLQSNFEMAFGHEILLTYIFLMTSAADWLNGACPNNVSSSSILRNLPGKPIIALIDGEFEAAQLTRLQRVDPDVYFFGFRDVLDDPTLKQILGSSRTKLFAFAGGGALQPEAYSDFVPKLPFRPCTVSTCAWIAHKQGQLLMTGNVNAIYPMRVRFVETCRAGNISVVQYSHPGYDLKHEALDQHTRYLEALTSHRFCLVGKRNDYALTKYYEAIASRCTIISDVPNDSILQIFLWYRVNASSTDAEIEFSITSAMAAWNRSWHEIELARYFVLSLYSAEINLNQYIMPALRQYGRGKRGVWMPKERCFQYREDSVTKAACEATGGVTYASHTSTAKDGRLGYWRCCLEERSAAGMHGVGYASSYISPSLITQYVHS